MDRVQGDGFYGEQTEVLNSDQVVELGADWKIRYLMCSVVPIGAVGGMQHGGLSIPTKGIIELVGPPVIGNHKLYASISFFTS